MNSDVDEIWDGLPIEDRLDMIMQGKTMGLSYSALAKELRPYNLTLEQWMKVVSAHLLRNDTKELQK